MALSNKTGLLAAVASHLNRNDLAAETEIGVDLCEAELNRRLRVRRMVTVAGAAIADGASALPGDYAGWISLTLDGRPLEFATPERLDREGQGAGTGRPRLVAVRGGELRYLPTPDAAYQAELTYYARIPPLTTGGSSNWALSEHPDLYLYGTLKHVAPFVVEDERAGLWAGLFERGLSEVSAASGREARGAGRLRTDHLPRQGGGLQAALRGRM